MCDFISGKKKKNSIPKIIQVTEEYFNEHYSPIHGKNDDVEELLNAIDKGMERRKLKK